MSHNTIRSLVQATTLISTLTLAQLISPASNKITLQCRVNPCVGHVTCSICLYFFRVMETWSPNKCGSSLMCERLKGMYPNSAVNSFRHADLCSNSTAMSSLWSFCDCALTTVPSFIASGCVRRRGVTLMGGILVISLTMKLRSSGVQCGHCWTTCLVDGERVVL